MLVKSDRLVAALGQRTYNNGGDVASAGGEIGKVRFIKNNNQQAIFLKNGALDQGIDIRPQPIVRGSERAVVSVVAEVGNDKGVFGQITVGQVHGKVRAGSAILFLRGNVLYIGHVGQGIVRARILSGGSGGVANAG